MQLASVKPDFTFHLFPDGCCKNFGGRHSTFHEINIKINVFMIKFAYHPFPDYIPEMFQVNDKTGNRIRFTFYRYVKLVIMTMPVRIGTFAKNVKILFVAPFRPEQFMSGIKMFLTGNKYHILMLLV